MDAITQCRPVPMLPATTPEHILPQVQIVVHAVTATSTDAASQALIIKPLTSHIPISPIPRFVRTAHQNKPILSLTTRSVSYQHRVCIRLTTASCLPTHTTPQSTPTMQTDMICKNADNHKESLAATPAMQTPLTATKTMLHMLDLQRKLQAPHR